MDKCTKDTFNWAIDRLVCYMKNPSVSVAIPNKFYDFVEVYMKEEGITYLRRKGYIFEVDLDEESSLEISHHSYTPGYNG